MFDPGSFIKDPVVCRWKRGNGFYCARHTDCNTMQTVNEEHVTKSADLHLQVTLSLTALTAVRIRLLVERWADRGGEWEEEREDMWKKQVEEWKTQGTLPSCSLGEQTIGIVLSSFRCVSQSETKGAELNCRNLLRCTQGEREMEGLQGSVQFGEWFLEACDFIYKKDWFYFIEESLIDLIWFTSQVSQLQCPLPLACQWNYFSLFWAPLEAQHCHVIWNTCKYVYYI